MKKEDMSCIDCAVKNCNKMDKTYPDFCLTTHMDEEVLNRAARHPAELCAHRPHPQASARG